MANNYKKKIILTGLLSVIFILPISAKALALVATQAATNITQNTATISGYTDDTSTSVQTWFQYAQTDTNPVYNTNSSNLLPSLSGTDLDFSSVSSIDITGVGVWLGDSSLTTSKAGNTNQANLTGLSPNSTYFYRLCMRDNSYYSFSGGGNMGLTQCGNVLSFKTTVPATPTVTISATPTSVTSGGSTEVVWSSTNATSCNVNENGTAWQTGLLGNFSSGALTSDTTFSITCTGDGGTVSNSTTVTVTATTTATPTVTISATPTSVTSGGSTEVVWSSTNANSCTVTKGGIPWLAGNSGDVSSGALTSDTTFTVTCIGNGGTISGLTTATIGTTGTTKIPYYSLSTTKFYSLGSLNVHSVQTGSFTGESTSSVVLYGSANPANIATSGYFRYSTVSPDKVTPLFCNDVYGSSMQSTNEVKLGTNSSGTITYGNDSVTFKKEITGLSANTVYYYCAMASDKDVIEGGQVMFFATSPMIETRDALVQNSSSAILNGFYNTVNPAETWFEYRQTSSSSDWTTVGDQNDNGGTSDIMTYSLTGLSANTSYDFRAGIKNSTTGAISYGNTLQFTTKDGDSGIVTGNYGGCQTGQNCTPQTHTLGETATPPNDAIVHYHEGIETVLARQIVKNTDVAEEYGYTEGKNLQAFAWTLADILAKEFGYVNSSGKEIRVSQPDIAAYELQLKDGNLTIYEYYNSKIVNIQTITESLRAKYYYEYYFNKK